MLIFLLIGLILGIILYAINTIIYNINRSNSSSALLISTYECGFVALINQSRLQHSINYYVIALLYVIFDLEVALILPAVVSIAAIGITGTIVLLLIMTLLCLCFIYELNIGIFTTIINNN